MRRVASADGHRLAHGDAMFRGDQRMTAYSTPLHHFEHAAERIDTKHSRSWLVRFCPVVQPEDRTWPQTVHQSLCDLIDCRGTSVERAATPGDGAQTQSTGNKTDHRVLQPDGWAEQCRSRTPGRLADARSAAFQITTQPRRWPAIEPP